MHRMHTRGSRRWIRVVAHSVVAQVPLCSKFGKRKKRYMALLYLRTQHCVPPPACQCRPCRSPQVAPLWPLGGSFLLVPRQRPRQAPGSTPPKVARPVNQASQPVHVAKKHGARPFDLSNLSHEQIRVTTCESTCNRCRLVTKRTQGQVPCKPHGIFVYILLMPPRRASFSVGLSFLLAFLHQHPLLHD